VSRISSKLVEESKQFKWSAKRLNVMDWWKKWLPFMLVGIIVLLVLLWRFYL